MNSTLHPSDDWYEHPQPHDSTRDVTTMPLKELEAEHQHLLDHVVTPIRAALERQGAGISWWEGAMLVGQSTTPMPGQGVKVDMLHPEVGYREAKEQGLPVSWWPHIAELFRYERTKAELLRRRTEKAKKAKDTKAANKATAASNFATNNNNASVFPIPSQIKIGSTNSVFNLDANVAVRFNGPYQKFTWIDPKMKPMVDNYIGSLAKHGLRLHSVVYNGADTGNDRVYILFRKPSQMVNTVIVTVMRSAGATSKAGVTIWYQIAKPVSSKSSDQHGRVRSVLTNNAAVADHDVTVASRDWLI